jgi:hypothetical protein
VYPNITKKNKIALCSYGALKVMRVILELKWTVLDHPLPIGTVVNGHYYCTLLQAKVRPAVFCKQPERLEYSVSLVQNNVTPHRHRYV